MRISGGPSADSQSSLWGFGGGQLGASSPRSPRNVKSAGAAGLLRPATASAGGDEAGGAPLSLTAEEALKLERLEGELRRRHATIGYYRDAISDLVLTSQFQEADLTHRSAQLQKLLLQSAAAGGAGGRSKNQGADKASMELEKKLAGKVQLYESRAADAWLVNRSLETIINELRRERADQLQHVKAREGREGAMAQDMRAFATAAHAALDEKERIKGRIRRLKHEWKGERTTQDTEAATLRAQEEDLDRIINHAAAEEERDLQQERRREAAQVRKQYKDAEFLERRQGYLRSQLVALKSEFRSLGEVAGVAGGGGKGGASGGGEKGGFGVGGLGAAERFSVEEPSTCAVLIRAMRANESRNESAHAYVQELDAEVTALQAEMRSLDDEENALIDFEQAEQQRESDAEARAAKLAASAAADGERHATLQERLASLRPVLASSVGRLEEAYLQLDETDNYVSEQLDEAVGAFEDPLPARSLPAGMKPLPEDAVPLHTALEVSLERLDGLLQRIGSRVARLASARAAVAAGRRGARGRRGRAAAERGPGARAARLHRAGDGLHHRAAQGRGRRPRARRQPPQGVGGVNTAARPDAHGGGARDGVERRWRRRLVSCGLVLRLGGGRYTGWWRWQRGVRLGACCGRRACAWSACVCACVSVSCVGRVLLMVLLCSSRCELSF